MVTTEINGQIYGLATTLRVAYAVQGQHNHAPYSKVFEKIGDMTLEEQIGILYCAFQVANSPTTVTKQQFMDYYLDNYNLKYVLNQLKAVITEIMGADEGEEVQPVQSSSGAPSTVVQGN